MKLKWMLPLGLAGVSLATWITFGVAVAGGAERKTLLLIGAIGALSLELVIWTTAAILGVSAFQARREIWRRVRSAFQRT
jgi:hypothetical protein